MKKKLKKTWKKYSEAAQKKMKFCLKLSKEASNRSNKGYKTMKYL